MAAGRYSAINAPAIDPGKAKPIPICLFTLSVLSRRRLAALRYVPVGIISSNIRNADPSFNHV
ncbi:MAG: hypothetical protein OXE85_11060, partial [Roseovarius sp.]|nr:hypothetical protein [Roseovarius sp.]